MTVLKRKAYNQIVDWKKSKEKKCLLVRGARQVGKSFIIDEFAKKNYDEVLSINFKETPDASEVFSENLDVQSMVQALRFRFPNLTISPEKTIIILDEIQECEEAITSLKFWAIDNRFDVIASGSMLGIDYKRASSFPVGYLDFLDMYGLDFEEFLWSCGITEKLIDDLKNHFLNKTPVPQSIHSTMSRLFREYMATGGMPEIVSAYSEHKNFVVVDKIQKGLLQGYLYDIAHYASSDEKIKAEKCFLSLSKQLLGKENHKFQYKEVEHNGKAQKYYSSLEWLRRADIVKICSNVSDVRFDLQDYEIDNNFRVYTSDLSLLIAMREYSLKQQIIENTLSGTTKGGMYECAIADILIKKQSNMWFFKDESKKKEIDFLIQDRYPVPIEVKSSNSKATSLNNLMKSHTEIPVAYKLIDGNVGISDDGRVISLPIYMAMFL